MALSRGSVVRGPGLGSGPRDLRYDVHLELSSCVSLQRSLSLSEPLCCCAEQKLFRGQNETAGAWWKLVAFFSSWRWAGGVMKAGGSGTALLDWSPHS